MDFILDALQYVMAQTSDLTSISSIAIYPQYELYYGKCKYVKTPRTLHPQSQTQRSEQTISFCRVLRKFLLGWLLDVVTDGKMKFVQGCGLHAVELRA